MNENNPNEQPQQLKPAKFGGFNARYVILSDFEAGIARIARMIPVRGVKPIMGEALLVAFQPFVWKGFERAAFVAYCLERGVTIAEAPAPEIN